MTRLFHAVTGMATTAMLTVATPVSAQSMSHDLGEFEFMNSCAQCHGLSGKGNGPLADLLSVAPSDLTQLQKKNGGVFPVTAIFATIEGGGKFAAHGTDEMPAWGLRYQNRAQSSADFGPGAMEQYPRMRILALIEYLAGFQEE